MIVRTFTDIYLDANATTPVLPQAAHDAQGAMEELFGNPSSSHITGIRARHILESARGLARSVLGAPSGRIIFTSGATEAIQMAIFSTLCRVREDRTSSDTPAAGRKLLYCATEHKAVPQALAHWNRLLGIDDEVLEIPVDHEGMLDLAFLRKHASSADMVCTMAVNNETGVIHDLAQIEETLRTCNERVTWMVDSVQAVGKVQLNLSSTTIDYAPISGHKIHASKGIGLLYVREGAPLTPLLAGGGQESGARSGTENLPGVAALAAVFRCLQDKQDSTFQSPEVLRSYRDQLVASLKQALPSIVFNTPFERAVPTTINFSVEGFTSKEILDLFDAAGIRVSSGSACGSALQGSYVLDAMGLPQWRSEGAIRISFGLTTTQGEIAAACRRIEETGEALHGSCLLVSEDDESTSAPVDGLIQLKKNSMCSWIYIDAQTRHCIIVDPFEELAERIAKLVRCQKCRVLAILDTHQHVDHDSCRLALLDELDQHLTEHARTADPLGWPDAPQGTVTIGDGSQAPYVRLHDDDVICQSDLPGHTIDGRAYLIGRMSPDEKLPPENVRFAFTGDTIQIGGIGRSDFTTSSVPALYESLRGLPRMVGSDTVLCPTHDYTNGFSTTMEAERRANRFLADVLDPVAPLSLEQFEKEKASLDAEIDDESNCELVCGRIHPLEGHDASVDIPPYDLIEFFANHKDALIIDVREPHEYCFTQDWAALGLDRPPQNIPLTRFSNFLQRLLRDQEPLGDRDIIFLCRSGNRSGKAAEVLRRVGISNARHIAGGIALGGRPNGVSADSLDVEYVI